MKKAFVLFSAIIMLIAFASVSMAADVMGSVTKFEAGKSITVKDSKAVETTATIDKATKVTGDVKVGSNVTMKVNGKVATEIMVQKAAAAAAPAPAPAPAPAKKAAGGY